MKPRTKKLLRLSVVCTLMLAYVVSVFYLSEPKYINNVNRNIQLYDYISIPTYVISGYNDPDQTVDNGLVLQIDTIRNKATVLVKHFGDEFHQIDTKNRQFLIIGKGTIYHKVNAYVGFNIMIITQIFIGILIAVLMVNIMPGLWEIINGEE